MKLASRFCALSLAMASLTACVTAESLSVSQLPPARDRKNVVTGSDSNLVVLFIPFGWSYAEDARNELLSKCKSGAIEGVVVKHESTRYLAALLVKESVKMRGYCVTR